MEQIIAYHCAPALAGIKPSNIVSFYKDKVADIHKKIKELNSQLNMKDIYIEILCECKKRVLVIVYRRKQLEKQLAGQELRSFLLSFGYPADGSLKDFLDFLRLRLKKEEFPHEIGVFLGYPLHDIYGFINHKNEGCKLVGEWKVYENVCEAKKLFDRFSACRKALCKRLDMGYTLAQMFCVA